MAYGQLCKITYPTGGYDTLEYGYNMKMQQHAVEHNGSFYFNCITSASASSAQDETILHLPIDQNINSILFKLYATGTATEDPIHDRATITIQNNSSGVILWTATLTNVGTSVTKDLNNLVVGDYLVKIQVSGRGMEGDVSFNYQSALPDTIMENVPLGGLNIHRIVSFDQNGQKKLTRRFEYIYKQDSSFSTFAVSSVNQLWETSIAPQMFPCASGAPCIHEADNLYLNISSNTLNPVSLLGSSPTYNRSVLEYSENMDSSLLTEHRFLFHSALSSNVVNGNKILNTPYCVYNNFLYGENVTNFYVQNAVDSFALIQSNEIIYSEDNAEDVVFNYNTRKKCSPTCRNAVPSMNHELLCLDIERYPIVLPETCF